MEFNECSDNDVQCRNGQCTPIDLYHDDPLNPDCSDATDERKQTTDLIDGCYADPSIRCEGYGFSKGFVCSDGDSSQLIEVTLFGSMVGCKNFRERISIGKILNANENTLLSSECRKVMNALFFPSFYRLESINVFLWIDRVEKHCDPIFFFPSVPVAFGHVFTVFTADRLYNVETRGRPIYVCFNPLFCPYLQPTIEINGSACVSFLALTLRLNQTELSINDVIAKTFRYCSLPNERKMCNNSERMYQCKESLNCISTRRLSDDIEDCYGGDDEKINFTCSLKDNVRISCRSGDICVSHLIAADVRSRCWWTTDNTYFVHTSALLEFSIVCDGFVEINLHLLVDFVFLNHSQLEVETDETHCEEWPCNNIYTRCDGFWNCRDGNDELNCPLLNSCSPDGFECLSPKTLQMTCLPASKAGNNITDCIGGTDERFFCRNLPGAVYAKKTRYRCWNTSDCISVNYMCDGDRDCPAMDDEAICRKPTGLWVTCERVLTPIDRLMCGLRESEKSKRKVPFSLTERFRTELRSQSTSLSKSQHLFMNEKPPQSKLWFCNRGIPFAFRQTSITEENLRCLCPASYYGNRCQFESQRVDISFRVRTLAFRTIFELVIILMDNTSQIHVHAQRELLPIRDCDLRFDITLLYSERPKNESLLYMVRIDMFNKLTSKFRASWLFPVKLPFLPVYRISAILSLLDEVNTMADCSTLGCLHGDCILTVNTRESFCRCWEGWSGISCDKWIGYCNCASNSNCVGLSNNRSICVCPVGVFGPRCFLTRSSCQPDPCMNEAMCVPTDIRISEQNFTCICKPGFTGTRCESLQSRIEISFAKVNSDPSLLFAHFITVMLDSDPLRATVLKKIAYDQDSVIVTVSDEFHLAFIETDKVYYLAVIQTNHIPSKYYEVFVQESNRCPFVDELLDSTIIKFESIRRIKYFQRPCRERPALQCFHDAEYMCVCNGEQYANCFPFNHTLKYVCQGLDYCQNGGQCFQDHPTCPSSILCSCSECFYGFRCQFKIEGMSLSLDAIIGYQIRPGVGLSQQSRVVKMSSVIVAILFASGMASSSFSINIFRYKICQEVGCGLYLLFSSVVSLFVTIIFLLKFTFLLLIQTQTITNRLALNINCFTVDILLTILTSAVDWLHACVAIERGIMVMKGIKFDKAKSKRMAKNVILLILGIVSVTQVHSFFYRQLINDNEEQRIWCIVSYPPAVQTFEQIKNLFHFSVPFCINIISAVVIIIITSRKRYKAQKKILTHNNCTTSFSNTNTSLLVHLYWLFLPYLVSFLLLYLAV